GKHLPGKDGEQKEEQNRQLEIVGTGRTPFGKIIETANEHDCPGNHCRDLEIRQTPVIEHSVKFPERDHAYGADQSVERQLVAGEDDQESYAPKDDRARETKNKSQSGGGRRGR